MFVLGVSVSSLAGCPKEKKGHSSNRVQPKTTEPAPPLSSAPSKTKVAPKAATPAVPVAAPAKEAEPLQMLKTGYDEGVFGAEFPESIVRAAWVKVTASSTLCEPRTGFCHTPGRIVDGESATAWCEGAPGKGVGSSVTFDLGRPRTIHAMRFEALYGKSKRTLLDNARVRKLAITTDDGQRFGVLFDDQNPKTLFISQIDYMMPTIELKKPLRSRRLIFEVLEVYPGRKFEDLCISEITLWIKR